MAVAVSEKGGQECGRGDPPELTKPRCVQLEKGKTICHVAHRHKHAHIHSIPIMPRMTPTYLEAVEEFSKDIILL